MGKRVAIVGTAPSWRQCPWDDPTLEIWGLNDAYTLGFPRASRWYDLHPLDRLHFRPKDQRAVYHEDVPYGAFVRPQGHLEWLQQQARTIPVFLQHDPPAGWPVNAQRFPFEEMARLFGPYWASGPSYEVAHAIAEGASEIQVWGIHLSTDAEYRDQRPNFEHLLGIARGRGIAVRMADASPVLKHGWQYAREPKPLAHPAKLRIQQARHDKSQLIMQLAQWPRFQSKAAALDKLKRLDAVEMDCARALSQRDRVTVTAPVLVEHVDG